MAHQLSPPAIEILAIIRAAFERVRTILEPDRGGPDWYDRWRSYSEAKHSLDHGLPVGDVLAEWIGHNPDGAERRRFHRALDELEVAGLIRRIRRWGERTTHLDLVEQPDAPNAPDERNGDISTTDVQSHQHAPEAFSGAAELRTEGNQ